MKTNLSLVALAFSLSGHAHAEQTWPNIWDQQAQTWVSSAPQKECDDDGCRWIRPQWQWSDGYRIKVQPRWVVLQGQRYYGQPILVSVHGKWVEAFVVLRPPHQHRASSGWCSPDPTNGNCLCSNNLPPIRGRDGHYRCFGTEDWGSHRGYGGATASNAACEQCIRRAQVQCEIARNSRSAVEAGDCEGRLRGCAEICQ